MLSIIFQGQENLLVLLSAFIIGGIFKTHKIFIPLFSLLAEKIKSKKLALLTVSLISGILPIEGRVSVSAPILDSLVKKNDCCNGHQPREKLGILDFIATHHYYLWSPLEKSVILIMAGLGISYLQLLSYTLIPILLYLGYLIFIVFKYVDDVDLELITKSEEYKTTDNKFGPFLEVLPFFAGIILSIFFEPYCVFPIVALFYILYKYVLLKEILSYIKWDTLLWVALVIILANIAKANSSVIMNIIHLNNVTNISTLFIVGLVLISGATASFILGSSGKYAGICVALTLVLGIKYFILILMAEYVGYLLSPTHKCLAISASYFDTKPIEFYKYIIQLCLLMLLGGLISFYLIG